MAAIAVVGYVKVHARPAGWAPDEARKRLREMDPPGTVEPEDRAREAGCARKSPGANVKNISVTAAQPGAQIFSFFKRIVRIIEFVRRSCISHRCARLRGRKN